MSETEGGFLGELMSGPSLTGLTEVNTAKSGNVGECVCACVSVCVCMHDRREHILGTYDLMNKTREIRGAWCMRSSVSIL